MNMSMNLHECDELQQHAPAAASLTEVTPLPTPVQLHETLPLEEGMRRRIHQHRQTIRRVLNGADPRTLVVIGPCSIHDEVAALEYGERLASLADELSDRFVLVMRAYLEKPRTTVGWKGLLYDPERTGRGDLALGLLRSRRLLLNLVELGLPLATEALSPLAMDYIEDLVSWTAIGARTTESQIHRELVSGLASPTGFKNGTDGSLTVAINAMKSAAHPHHRLGLQADGSPAMLTTAGNADTHLVLRGGRGTTNYDAGSVNAALAALEDAGLEPRVMVDCSHDNACKQAQRQIDIAREVMAQKAAGNHRIRGLMLESFLVPGRQNDGRELVYGQSITDACIGWEQTEALLRRLV